MQEPNYWQRLKLRRLGRRRFLRGAALGTAGLATAAILGCGDEEEEALAPGTPAAGTPSGEALTVGAIHDQTGVLAVYNELTKDSVEVAVEDVNDNGGVLGRPLDLVFRDAQSLNEKYTEFATELVVGKKVAMLEGGGTSASREAIRPVIDSNGGPIYFYPTQYEGGVCDKWVFVTGETAAQQLAPLIRYAVENLGKKFYILAADYVFGQVSAQFAEIFLEEQGAELLGTEFFPLDVGDFGAAINRIQAAEPDVIISFLVGSTHLGYHRQLTAAGLEENFPTISTVLGVYADYLTLSPQETKGVVAAFSYHAGLDNPTNKNMVDRLRAKRGGELPFVSEYNSQVWDAWHLWAIAVNQAGTLDQDKVIEVLESGLEYDSPSGRIRLDGGTHHLVHNMFIGQINAEQGIDILETFPNVEPTFEKSVCNLIDNPDTHTQFTP